MRVVVVNHYPVLPVRNGGQQAVSGLALQLAQRWPTTLIWTERKRDTRFEAELEGQRLQVRVVPNLWRQRKAVKLLAPLLGSPDGDFGSMLFSGSNGALLRALEEETHDGDLLVLAHPWLWPAVRQLMARRRVTLVYDAHNVESVIKRQSQNPGFVSERLLARLAAMEAQIVQRAALTLACTQGDAQVLGAAAGVPPQRFLVGSKGYRPAPAAIVEAALAQRARNATRPVALFVGSDHPPNNQAARWIASTLAPACPQWRFRIVGACAAHAGPAAAGAELVGPVDDLGAELAGADLALNPVDTGSGINMKLFDYLQYGLPVLCTPFGARGFEHLQHTGLYVAERDAMAQALAELLARPELRAELARQGPRTVAEHFAWPVVGARVRAALAAFETLDTATT